MDKIRVLIADDHPAFREGLCRLLRDEKDLEVVSVVGDGESAVESAKQFKPDVAIVDISMPKLNGIEAAKQIKEFSSETAVLMVSAYSYPSYVLAALRGGAAGYLLKDTPLSDIINAIRMVNSGEAVFDMKATGKILRRIANDKSNGNRVVEELQPREIEVLNLAAKGVGNKEIATKLNISERTVQTHLVNVFRKLHVSSRTEAVLYALKEGWLTMEDLPDRED